MICHECGGSDIQRTCMCSYEFPPESEPDMSPISERERWLQMLTGEGSYAGPPPYATTEPPYKIQQVHKVCQFCGSNLFTQPGSELRMCLPCAKELGHKDCVRCVRCNKTWLVDGGGCVCVQCYVE